MRAIKANANAVERKEKAAVGKEVKKGHPIAIVQDGGSLKIADRVIEMIVFKEASQIDEIEAFHGTLTEEFLAKLQRGEVATGVKVEKDGEEVDIELKLTVVYGVKIQDLAAKLRSKIKESVETMTPYKVRAVNIEVEGISTKSGKLTQQGKQEQIGMKDFLGDLKEGQSPLVATAIHDGHEVRLEVAELLALSPLDRLREEDPYTATWTEVAESRIVVRRSRFDVDLNRPRDKAVYVYPEDAWGLQVWRRKPHQELIQRSLSEYDLFYTQVHQYLHQLEQQFGSFVVLDLHTYNHRRAGPHAPPADPEMNPEVNLGTGTLDHDRWAPLVGRLVQDLRDFNFLGRHLEVRENVKFKGGQFSRWINTTFPKAGCALAIEFKKFFMDEWSGELDLVQHEAIREALASVCEGILEELQISGLKG